MAEITPDVAAAAYTIASVYDSLVEDGAYCTACGDPFEVGQQVLHVRLPEFDRGSAKAVGDVHLRCYQGEEVKDHPH